MDDKIDNIHKKSLAALEEYLKNMTEEQKAELREQLKDKNPKGWVSIEDALPMVTCGDVLENNALIKFIKVKNDKGEEFESQVGDHNTWYYHAKENGITHWWND